jgi:regulator of sigma E protease
MSFLSGGLGYIVPFLIVLTVLVFVHELGHYLVARRNGVRIEVFSIGFGPEIFGWHDRAGTRWKFSVVPLGGYVKMFGDSDASSMPSGAVVEMSAADRAVSFHHKRLGQRAAVVAAGPIANYLFAILIFAILFATVGEQFTPPDVGQVQENSAAQAGGIKPGDTIVAVDGQAVQRFEDVQQAVRLNDGSAMQVVVRRDGTDVPLSVTPQMTEVTDHFGNVHRVGLLGISRAGVDYVRRDPATAVWRAVVTTWDSTTGMLTVLGQMVMGTRATDELGGPLRIAEMSGDVAKIGIVPLIGLTAALSVSLGLINLFPIPVLDGGHLLFYLAEAIRGKPLGMRAQEYGFRIGLALVMSLMIFVTWHDLVHLGPRIVSFFKGLST